MDTTKSNNDNAPDYTQTDPTSEINALKLENERLQTLLNSLLTQAGANNNNHTSGNDLNGNHHARLFRLDADLSDNASIDNLLAQHHQQQRQHQELQHQHNVDNNNDFTISNVDYDALASISQSLETQLTAARSSSSPTTTTSTTTTTNPRNINTPSVSFSAHNPNNMTSTNQQIGPNDQIHQFELPHVQPNEQHLVTEIPSITSVQTNRFNSNMASLTVVTQREQQNPPTQFYSVAQQQQQQQQLQPQPTIWQEALVLEIRQEDFWVIVPHTQDIEQRQRLHDSLALEDSTFYYPTADELETEHEFGVHVPSSTFTNDDGYLLLETDRVQTSLVNYISSIVSTIPSIGQYAERELLDALTSVLQLDEADLVCSKNVGGISTFSPTTTTTTTASNTTSPKQTGNKTANNNKSNKQKNDAVSARDVVSTAQFVTDAVSSGKMDPQKAINHLQRFLPQKVSRTCGWLSWLYDWSTWSYTIWSYGAMAWGIYSNPTVGASVLTWIYKGATYALLFLL